MTFIITAGAVIQVLKQINQAADRSTNQSNDRMTKTD